MADLVALGMCYHCMRVSFAQKAVCGRNARRQHGWDKWENFCRKIDKDKHETKTSEITLKWFYQKEQNI